MATEQTTGETTYRSPGRTRPSYIHELDDWPNFRWDPEAITSSLIRANRRQVEVVGNVFALGALAANEATVRNLTDSAVASSRIEGENPDPAAIRDSIARRIVAESQRANRRDYDEPGIAAVTTDAATNYTAPLTQERLHGWHRQLFSARGPGRISIGLWRDDQMGPMQVVSGGPMRRKPTVHFQAPPAHRLDEEMTQFLNWFNQPEAEPDLRKAAVAHLWFVTIHPYDDGNGRIARAVTDLALARWDRTPVRFYSMSAEIMRQRSQYYRALQTTQSGSMDITAWMIWFLDCLTSAMNNSDRTAEAALSRAKLQPFAQANSLNERQVKVVGRLIEGWEGNITANRYGRMTGCSRQTAIRDINRLMELGILARNESSGRSTSYRVQQLP
jgi:Fic family protein